MEQKRLDRKNLIVISVVILLIAAAGGFALWQRHQLAAIPEDTTACTGEEADE